MSSHPDIPSGTQLSSEDKLISIHTHLRSYEWSITDLLDAYLTSSHPDVRRSVSQWTRSDTSRQYGPALVTRRIFEAAGAASTGALKRLTSLTIPLLRPALDKEVIAAKSDDSFRSIVHLEGEDGFRANRFNELSSGFQNTLPLLLQMASLLAGATTFSSRTSPVEPIVPASVNSSINPTFVDLDQGQKRLSRLHNV
ncbi:hypothetical protein CF327_g4418 [Tilletia walkeri]|nr:hypothetical protein CF327_g4418 [Tilletia walkeri]